MSQITKYKSSGSIDPQALVVEDKCGRALFTDKLGAIASIFYQNNEPELMDYLCAIFSHAHEMALIMKYIKTFYDNNDEIDYSIIDNILKDIKSDYNKFDMQLSGNEYDELMKWNDK